MAIWGKVIFGVLALSALGHIVGPKSNATAGSSNATSSSAKAPAKSQSPARPSIEAVLSDGGTLELADPLSNKPSTVVVSNGWLTPPFGKAAQMQRMSLPTAKCQGIATAMGKHVICQNVSSQPVNGFSGDGRPVTLNVPKGGWYYMYEFDSNLSPALKMIVATAAL